MTLSDDEVAAISGYFAASIPITKAFIIGDKLGVLVTDAAKEGDWDVANLLIPPHIALLDLQDARLAEVTVPPQCEEIHRLTRERARANHEAASIRDRAFRMRNTDDMYRAMEWDRTGLTCSQEAYAITLDLVAQMPRRDGAG